MHAQGWAADRGESSNRLLRCVVLCAVAIVAGWMATSVCVGTARADDAPCTIYWLGGLNGGSSQWTDPTDWSNTDGGPSAGRVPGASDFVCRSTGAGGYITPLNPYPGPGKPYDPTITIAGIDWPASDTQQEGVNLEGGFDLVITGSSGASSFINATGGDGDLTLQGGPLEVSTCGDLTDTIASIFYINGGTLDLDFLGNGCSIMADGGTATVGAFPTGARTLTSRLSATQGGTLTLPDSMTSNASAISASTGGVVTAAITSNSGDLNVSDSGEIDLGRPDLTNSGSVGIADGGTLHLASYTQTSDSSLYVSSGGVLDAPTITIDSGRVVGDGSLDGDVSGAGDLEPSVSNALTIGEPGGDGSYENGAGTLTATVANPGYDSNFVSSDLVVNGPVALGGTLDINSGIYNFYSFAPPFGQTFTILQGTSIAGTFSAVTGTQLGYGHWDVAYSPTAVTVTLVADPPVVESVTPASGPVAGGNTVTITGEHFTDTENVFFGATRVSNYKVVSDTEITATVPAGLAGTDDVTVVGLGATSAESPADQYTYLAPPVPSVTAITPAAGPTVGGTQVTITGSDFSAASTVRFGSRRATNVVEVSPTELLATSPGVLFASTVDVTVTNSDGTSATSGADRFAYQSVPAISRVTPAVGPDAGGTTVTISGTKFTPDATVAFGSTPATSSTYVSSTELQAVSPATTTDGPVDVRVSTSGGQTPVTARDVFTYGPPSITNISPQNGITGSRVTITGTGFTTGATVSFAGLASPSVSVRSGTTIVAVVPNGATAGTITVTADTGTATSAATFTPTLSITAVNPTSAAPGATVEIDGVGFIHGSSVRLGGVAARVTFVSSTELQATVPANASSGPVTVTNFGKPFGRVTAPTPFTIS